MGQYDDIAEAFHRAATNFDTSSAKAVEQHFKDMKDLFEGMARSLGVSKGYLEDNFSVDQAVPDTLEGQSRAMGQIAHEQELLSHTYRRRHESDFSRIEDPRRHEKAWDYTTNQDEA